MENIILATPAGADVRTIFHAKADFEIGKEDNTFELTFSRYDWTDIEAKSRIYIPNTEFGGLARRTGTTTKYDEITVGGITWRGMMAHKVIQPASGQDYATASGEINAIIKSKVEAEFPGLFRGVSTNTGVRVTSYKFDRYCTLLDGLAKMLRSVGYKLDIQYIHDTPGDVGYVQVQAVPIVDYSAEIELSSDSRLDYVVTQQTDGVNHLILLGSGELKERTVRHLYVNAQGKIVTSQVYKGIDEVTAVYDGPGAEENDLVQGGTERLKELMNADTFSMDVAALGIEVAIGDIVGGRDYLTGLYMARPVAGKIYKYENAVESMEYVLEEDE